MRSLTVRTSQNSDASFFSCRYSLNLDRFMALFICSVGRTVPRVSTAPAPARTSTNCMAGQARTSERKVTRPMWYFLYCRVTSQHMMMPVMIHIT